MLHPCAQPLNCVMRIYLGAGEYTRTNPSWGKPIDWFVSHCYNGASEESAFGSLEEFEL